MELLQAENEISWNFLERTDQLAAKLGINVQDLTKVLGIGRASLFCCRKGTRSITQKTWLKLEAAEKKALKEESNLVSRETRSDPNSSTEKGNFVSHETKLKGSEDDPHCDITARLGRIEALLCELVAHFERQETRPPTSSKDRGEKSA